MLKRILIFFMLSCVSILFADDSAAFIDEGFSNDGNYFVFGQYGNNENSQGYAEIYTIDIAANDYEDSGLFFTKASSATNGKNGHTLYTDLRRKNSNYLNDLELEVVDIDSVLYLNSGLKSPTDKIVVKDFEKASTDSSETYTIQLNPWYSGNTATSKSSFFITVEKVDSNGKVLGKQVIGNPDIKRTGVIGYSIEKIMKSPNGESFIFIIEKNMATIDGVSVRYMVETLEVANFN